MNLFSTLTTVASAACGNRNTVAEKVAGHFIDHIKGKMKEAGGVQEFTQQLKNNGLAQGVINSWTGTGENDSISGEQAIKAIPGGPQLAEALEKATGLPITQVANAAAQMLPKLVDGLTPGGKMPKSLDEVFGKLTA